MTRGEVLRESIHARRRSDSAARISRLKNSATLYLLNMNRDMAVGDRLCGLVVRVLGYSSGGPGSIPGTTKKSSGSGTGSTQPHEYN
jgi:hypothetical protein